MSRGKTFPDSRVIVDEAVRLMGKDGFPAFSTRRLAASLGSSVMTLYNYYENREAITKEAIIAAFGFLVQGLPGRMEPFLAGEHLREFAGTRPRPYEFLLDTGFDSFLSDPRITGHYGVAFDRIAPMQVVSAVSSRKPTKLCSPTRKPTSGSRSGPVGTRHWKTDPRTAMHRGMDAMPRTVVSEVPIPAYSASAP